MIQVFRPCIGDEEIAAVTEVLRSGWLGLGPRTAEFERRFAEYVGAPFAVATNSGTAALHLALAALGIGRGDEVLVPALTFASTAHAVRYCGARPVFVDVEEDILCMDPSDALKKVSAKTRAILPVHYAGHPARMAAFWDLAESETLFVVEDAAHACGAEYDGRHRRVGGNGPGSSDWNSAACFDGHDYVACGQSDAVCFSFHAVKNLTTGEGGMATFASEHRAKRARRLAWCGIDKSTWERTEATGANELRQYGWYYEITELGFKYHMSDVAAAIGLVQLGKLERLNARRREIVSVYNRAFCDLAWLQTPCERDNVCSSWHAYVVRTPYRDKLNVYLKERGIATGVHYVPLHLQPAYHDPTRPRLPVTEAVWPTLLTLPLYPDLTDADVERVVEGVRSFGVTI